MPVYLSNRQKVLPVRPLALRRRLGRLLEDLGLAETGLSVSLVGDAEMRLLNRRYRRRDKPTNVLSFPLDGGGGSGGAGSGGAGSAGGGPPRLLGDLVVSAETVLREAAAAGRPPGETLYFYLVHGLTHLAGYDHELGPAQAARQEAETERLLGLIPRSL